MTVIQDPIKNAIWCFLNHYAYKDALFLAERLYAEVHSDEALYLLATTYFRLGKMKTVQVLFEKHGLLQPQCKYLYAQACWELENYAKAEQVLAGGALKFGGIHNVLSTLPAEYGESACFALALLGKIYIKTERADLAKQCFIESLQLNPFLWSSFEKMCQAGFSPDPEKLFNSNVSHTLYDYKSISSALNASVTQSLQTSHVRKKKGNAVKVLTPSQVGSNTENVDSATGTFNQTPEIRSYPNRTPQSSVPIVVAPFCNDEENMGSCERKIPTHNDTEFLRSTPSETNQWDSSIDSYAGSHPGEKRFTRTQMRISSSLLGGTATLSPLTPSFGVTPLLETPSPVLERYVANTTPTDAAPPPHELNPPVKKMITRQSRKAGDAASSTAGKLFFSSENSRRETNTTTHMSKLEPPVQNQTVLPRRSTRFANSANSVKENTKKTTKGKSTEPKDVTNKKQTRSRSKQNSDMPIRNLSEEISKVDCMGEKVKASSQNICSSQITPAQRALVDGLMKLFQNMGKAVIHSNRYNCKQAISCIESFPPHQKDTTWSLSLLARCYFEMTEYKSAAKVFQELRRNHPHHVSGLALYSTTLWHLQDNVTLSTLAHDLVALDTLSPETWCAVGNCFSLRRDYESAVKFFARAVQLAPRYAYAHTLLGHEYAYSDDNERAMACFRKAIHCDSRHYNALYGIGSIYYKQENFALAEIHFRKALAINPRSSVLLCHLGIVQHAQKRSSAALKTLANALDLDPRNPLCKFHRASVLFATERFKDALQELLELKQIVPKESLVYFLIGKTYKILGDSHLAMMNFSWALDLDPKGVNNHIKEAIDKQQAGDENTAFGSPSSETELMDSTSQEDDSTGQDLMQDSDASL